MYGIITWSVAIYFILVKGSEDIVHVDNKDTKNFINKRLS